MPTRDWDLSVHQRMSVARVCEAREGIAKRKGFDVMLARDHELDFKIPCCPDGE